MRAPEKLRHGARSIVGAGLRRLGLGRIRLGRIGSGRAGSGRQPAPAALTPSLRRAVERSHWRPSTAGWELLTDLGPELADRADADIAVLVGNKASPLGPVLAAAFPGITLHRIDLRVSPSELHAALAASGPYDLIIDDSRRVSDRRRVLRDSWYHLRPGGLFVIRDLRSARGTTRQRPIADALRADLADMITRRGRPRPTTTDAKTLDKWQRAEALGRFTFGSRHLIMQNLVGGSAKMREAEMNQVITLRHDRRARLLRQLPPQPFTSKAELDPERLFADTRRYKINYTPPPLSVRSYQDVIVHPHQVAVQGNLILPETYRHHLYGRLRNRATREISHYFATVDHTGPIRRLPGRFFHLDAEWREHFGHLLTEQLSRLWAWPELKRQYPDLKVLMSLQRGHERPRQWELDILAAAGVAADDVTILNGPARVDELIGATPMLSMPSYIDPRITDFWDQVGDALVDAGTTGADTGANQAGTTIGPGKNIFVSRPYDSHTRPCHNIRDVEQYFADRDFDVVHPESMTVADQVRTFRSASLITGFGGSAMFTLMFRPTPAPVVLLRPSSYTSVNEYLISAVRGHQLTVIDSAPDQRHPEDGWTYQAFYSGFTFDFDAEGRRLDKVLDRMTAATGSAR